MALVTITIDGQDYQVLAGANLVDTAKMLGTDIPVFCYHPKMKPVGMCRMCLVELGSVSVNRETGQPELDENGAPVVRWFRCKRPARRPHMTAWSSVRQPRR